MSLAASQLNDKFTVHNYTSLRSTSLAGAASKELLASAQNIIKACSSRCNPSAWQNVGEGELVVWGPRKLYAYNSTLPTVSSGKRILVPDLKEWGSLPDETEQWRLGDLEEFVSTDFSGVFLREKPVRILVENPLKRAHSINPWDETAVAVPSAPKRRKLDEGPLHSVLPRPHMYPSHQLDFGKNAGTALKPYKKTTPIFLSPYTDPLPEPSMYDRRAWVIPIRGTLPWKNTTPAEILQPLETVPTPPALRSLEPIIWSWSALQAFWEFLKILRAEGKLGTLGLSFQPSIRYTKSAGDNSASFTSTSNGGGESVLGQNTTGPRLNDLVFSDGSDMSTLASVDYIKVYHDATKSMLLRTAFDVWMYEVRDGKGALVERIRVLKGAKLVLMDHLSMGMLIS